MISESQKEIINFAAIQTQKYSDKPLLKTYFALFEKTPGYYLIKSNIKKIYIFKYFYTTLKYLFGIVNNKISHLSTIKLNHYYKKIKFSWAFYNSFDENGVFHDKYLKTNNEDDFDVIWILIYMDKKLPKKIGKNIFLFYKEKNLLPKILFFLKFIFLALQSKILTKKSSIRFDPYSALSYQMIKVINEEIEFDTISEVLIVYEGQPFQKDLIKYLRNKKLNNILGYDHSAPPPLPLNLFCDDYSPDTLLITGKSQLEFYVKYLSWPSNRLKIIESSRFKSENKDFYLNKIFLPYELSDKNVYLKSINYLCKEPDLNFNKITIKNHPLQTKSNNHLQLIDEIKATFETNSNISKTNCKDFSIFFGQTTSVIVALDLGLTCYHVCPDPVFDSYNSELWKNISVQKINSNLFKYTPKKLFTFLHKL